MKTEKLRTITNPVLLISTLSLATLSTQSQAANWIMLQGSEAPNKEKRVKVFGLLQANYQKTDNSALKAGPGAGNSATFNQVNPAKNIASGFNIKRARIGSRGAGFVLDKRFNYFIAADLGSNSVTTGEDASVLADASITYHAFPGLKIRLGQFKHPTSYESLSAPIQEHYINYSAFTNMLGKEAYLNPNDRSEILSTSAFRDRGIQFFDTFKQSEQWEHTYAVMIGNGSLHNPEQTKGEDLYLKWSSYYLFQRGRKAHRQDIEFTAWHHQGQRKSFTDDSAYDISRSGLGLHYFDGRYRFTAEWAQAQGKIPSGSTGGMIPGTQYGANQTAVLNTLDNEKADGYYLDFGYRLTPNIELDLRYDILNQMTENKANLKEHKRWTVGAQYHFNPKSKLVINYEMKQADAPNNATADTILSGTDNLLALELTHVF